MNRINTARFNVGENAEKRTGKRDKEGGTADDKEEKHCAGMYSKPREKSGACWPHQRKTGRKL